MDLRDESDADPAARPVRRGAAAADRDERPGVDAALLAALAVVLAAWFLGPFILRRFAFPLGPDAPVYLWWTRLAGEEGLSAVGHRPGVPALALALRGTLGVTVVQAVSALEVALSVAVGLASAALVRGRTTRAGWVLAGLLAGTFAVHLATGYLANLAFAAAFVAAATTLAEGTRRGAVVAALILAGGGLAHPLFFLLGAAILVGCAALTWPSDRAQALRIGGAALGGGALLGAGLLALLAGPPPPAVDTSKDGFLRRAGLEAELRRAYLDRFVRRWTRYVQWASIPLGAGGLFEIHGFVLRFLGVWGASTVAGVGVALATAWVPADRFVTFGFAVPILAALGLARLVRIRGARRPLAVAAAAVLAAAILAGSLIAWARQEPFLDAREARALAVANRVAAALDLGVPLAFWVNEPDETVTFLATRAANVIRAAMPPDRVRDVVVVVPPLAGAAGAGERRALERTSARDLEEAERTSGRPGVVFVVRPFDPIDVPGDAWEVAEGVLVLGAPPIGPSPTPVDPLAPSAPGGIALAAVLTLGVLAAAGYGWARAATADPVRAAALAPTVGACAWMLSAVALERLGAPPSGWAASIAALSLAGGGGYLAWGILQRRARTRGPA